MPLRGTFGNKCSRQAHRPPCAGQPGIDSRIYGDDFIEAQVVFASDVGQRVFLLGLDLPRLTDQILIRLNIELAPIPT